MPDAGAMGGPAAGVGDGFGGYPPHEFPTGGGSGSGGSDAGWGCATAGLIAALFILFLLVGYFESPRTSATGQSTFTFATAWIAVGAAVGFVLIVGAVTLMINHHPKIGEVSGDLLRPIITLILVLVVTALVLAVTLIIFVGMGYALGRNSGRVQHFLGASLIHFTVAGGVASALGFLMLASGLLLVRYRRRREYLR